MSLFNEISHIIMHLFKGARRQDLEALGALEAWETGSELLQCPEVICLDLS